MRAGAGRPKGASTPWSARCCRSSAAEDRQLPLYRLLDRIADPTLDEKYCDTLCVAILPQMHSRMPATMILKPLHLMSDAELQKLREVELEHRRQVALGRDHLRVANEDPGNDTEDS